MSLDFLSQIGSVWLFVALALLLVAALVLVFLSGMVRQPSPERAPENADASKFDLPKLPKLPLGPSLRGAGWESASASFARTMAFLKNTVTGGDYRYQIPWFLVVGEPGSGKSALLAQTGVNLAPEEGSGEADSSNPLEWRFLDKGILLGVAGNYFAARNDRARDENGWPRLLRLLQNNRPRRPMDGVVLAIPATDLIGQAAREEAQLGNRASRMADMLALAQRTLGFTFPVYIVVTKCDEIPGFATFCRELPARGKNEIFGWSSPYNVEATFTPDWIVEAFDSVSQDLRRLQSEIFVEKTDMARPEDVFLFPEELLRMRVPARVYLDRLFRETAYRESFRFRGIYFTGDISETPISEGALPPVAVPAQSLVPAVASGAAPAPALEQSPEPGAWIGELAPARANASRLSVKAPVFLRDLFERKIFPEAGLAEPISKLFIARTRSVLVVQVTAALLALILIAGTVFGYRRLASGRATLMTMLDSMAQMPRTPESERHNLLAALAPAGNVHYHSFFLPTSYLSSLDSDITDVMVFASNKWVLKNILDSLNGRAQKILNQPALDESAASGAKPANDEDLPTTVETTAEYQQLNRFVTDLDTLQENAAAYDGLSVPGKPLDLEKTRKLLLYLYGKTFSDFQTNGHLFQALYRAAGERFSISNDDQSRASKIMLDMIKAMFTKWFESSLLIEETDLLREKINQLELGRGITAENLRELSDLIKQTENDFGSPAFRWAGNPALDLENGSFRPVVYEPLKVRRNPYLAPNIYDEALRYGGDSLRQFHTKLVEERTNLTDALLNVGDPVTLSSGTRSLQMALDNELNLSFVSNESARPVRTKFDEKSKLIWMQEHLKDAKDLLDLYKRFKDEGLRNTSPQLRATLDRVALEKLRRNVEDDVFQAQDIQSRNVPQNALTSEDETLPEVAAFRDASQSLLDLAERCKQLGFQTIYNEIHQVMVYQSLNLLNILDRRLKDEDPYAAKSGNFGWWDGKPGLSLAAYDVANSNDLQDMLNAQRDRIKFLVDQSDPLIAFLNNPDILREVTRSDSQSKLISKWQQLLGDFKQYNGKKPGASVTSLEQFILSEMDTITPQNSCVSPSAAAETKDQNLDFFLQIRFALRVSIVNRCRALSSDALYKTYSEISDLFNRTLSGKFPFGPIPVDRTSPEATPENIVAFYKLFDAESATARNTLKESARFGTLGKLALQFLDQMDAVRQYVFFGGDKDKEPPFSLDFSPHFRTNQGGESGANEIIEWTMQVGGQIFHSGEPDHSTRWRQGGTVRLSLRWAADSTFQPVADSQPNLKIRSRTAFYEYLNRWSLLAFVMRQQALPSDLAPGADTRPYTLKFNLKTVRDPKWTSGTQVEAGAPAVAFMHANVSLPGSRTPATLPYFPNRAPRLDEPGRPLVSAQP